MEPNDKTGLKPNGFKVEAVLSNCSSTSHHLLSIYDEEFNHAFLQIRLNKLPFWLRIKRGIKYILGRDIAYGDYEEVLLDETNVAAFERIVNNIKKNSK